MKKQLFYLLLTLALAACGNNQDGAPPGNRNTSSGNTTLTESNSGRSGKSLDEMPGPIRASFQNRYPAATVDEWERETENGQEVYKVAFKQDNADKKAWFDATGNFLRQEND
jgi:nitrous oxide reductase accessory protein NosL